ncbi:MAG: hypothetical protein KAV82_10220, partial [Phycisphaerae bacterium]|nr:hypothetical protein [Phycisphaerae bacterium]
MRISRNPFMVGLACILTLNICLAPALYAQGSPSRSDEDDYLALQASIFDTLFGTPWTGEDWAYPLAERVEGTGEYAGVNRYGQEFTFTIVTAEPLDLEEAGLSPEQLQTAIEEQISMSSIVALLTTSQAEIGIQGVATSGYLDGEGELLSFIIICELADPDGPLFQDYGDDSLVVIQPQIMPLGTVTTQDTTGSFGVTRSYRVGNINSAGSVNGQGTSATVKPTPVSLAMSATVSDDCAAACHDAYNNTMDDIAQTLQAALTAAQNARDAAITAAQNALDAALTAAQNDLDAALTA